MIGLVRKFLAIFLTILMAFVYFNFEISTERYFYTSDMVLTLAPLSAKSALRNFQEETRMDLYSSSSGSISPEYSSFLSWLGEDSAFSEVVTELRNGYSEGLNPMNYAIPFVDKDKLEIEFNQLLNIQMEQLKSGTYSAVKSIKGTVSSVDKQINNFNTQAITWGIGSSFYSNTAGHTMYYDYDKYVTYKVTFKVEAVIDLTWGVTDIHAGDRTLSEEFDIIYELLN